MSANSQILQKQLYQASQKQYQNIKKEVNSWFHSVLLNPASVKQDISSFERMLGKESKRLLNPGVHSSKRKELRDIFLLFHVRELGRYNNLSTMNPESRKLYRKILNKRLPSSGNKAGDEHVMTALTLSTFLLPGSATKSEQDHWLQNQLEQMKTYIPDVIMKNGAFSKVYRTILGVMMYCYSTLPSKLSLTEKRERLFCSLQAGFHFGLLYPLVDDVFDTKGIMSHDNQKQFVELLNHWIGGDLNYPNPWPEDLSMKRLNQLAHDLNLLLPIDSHPDIYQAFYILHFSQIEDLQKKASGSYTSEEIYIPLIIKAAYTRILAARLGGIRVDRKLHDHLLKLGLYLQLHDDLRDWKSDSQNGVFTPFTNFMSSDKHQSPNPLDMLILAVNEFIARYNYLPEAERIIMGRFSRTFARMLHRMTEQQGIEWVNQMTPDGSVRQELLTKLLLRADSITDSDERMVAMFERAICKNHFFSQP